jgi:hypothetical protein
MNIASAQKCLCRAGLSSLTANISLCWKGLSGTNSLACYEPAKITSVKRFNKQKELLTVHLLGQGGQCSGITLKTFFLRHCHNSPIS